MLTKYSIPLDNRWKQISAAISPWSFRSQKKKKVNTFISDLKHFNTICYLQLHKKKWKIHSRRRLPYELHYPYEWISFQWKALLSAKNLSQQSQTEVTTAEKGDVLYSQWMMLLLILFNTPAPRALSSLVFYTGLHYPIQVPHRSIWSWDQLDCSPRTSSVTSIFMNQAIKLSY